MALNIDPATHTDDHVPYSSETLGLYREHLKWAQTQERELRIFAADDTQKRLRFKAMPAHYRAFLHSVAEDFGFDHESLDPEPHRHVVLFKTPRFVKAPMKTLADCVRIRAMVAVPSNSSASNVARLEAPNDPFNGFLLTSPRFGLTVEELRSELSVTVTNSPTLAFDVAFLPSEEIVLKAKPSSHTTTITPPSLEAAVKALKASLASAVTSKKLAASTSLCALDLSLNILRRESDKRAGESGWSQVAAKATGTRLAPKPAAWGSKSSFMVLGRKKKQETKKEEVVDDWEEEMNKEERADEAAQGQHDGHGADTDMDNESDEMAASNSVMEASG
ncbi:MAG: FKBP12-associated protein [Stictis urceolatum]|nr:FKBP12-associated protein [Stictis urceolata]